MTKAQERRLQELEQAACDVGHEVRVVWYDEDPENDPMPAGLRRWVNPVTGDLHIRLVWLEDEITEVESEQDKD